MIEFALLIIPVAFIILGIYLFFNPNMYISKHLKTMGLFGANIKNKYGEEKSVLAFRLISFWLIVVSILVLLIFLAVIHYIQTNSTQYTKIMVNYMFYIVILIVIISNISFRVLLKKK